MFPITFFCFSLSHFYNFLETKTNVIVDMLMLKLFEFSQPNFQVHPIPDFSQVTSLHGNGKNRVLHQFSHKGWKRIRQFSTSRSWFWQKRMAAYENTDQCWTDHLQLTSSLPCWMASYNRILISLFCSCHSTWLPDSLSIESLGNANQL